MRLLVTGGAGFIGSNFIRYWLRKHHKDTIVNLDKLTYAGNLKNLEDITGDKRYEFIKGDISERKDVEQAFRRQIDIVINFAAESHVDRSIYGPLIFVKTNVLGTAVLLEAARRHKVKRFIHVSTDEVYGQLPLRGKSRFKNDSKYQPNSPYAASKAGSDHLVRAYWKTYNMPTIVTNCSNNVGPYQHPEKFIPLAITNILEGKPVRIYGRGRNKRDWIWVFDHIAGLACVVKKGKPGQTYLFGGKDGARFSNLAVAKKIIQKMGRGEIEFVPDRPGHDLRYEIDYSLTKKELGWQPLLGLDQILEKTIQWYQENEWWWKPLKKNVVFNHAK